MPSFSLVIEYLTGYAIATDPANRERAEWPPHPARVFMALAAAHFESGGSREEKRAEREALDWLAGLDPPALGIPSETRREVLTVYVPVNDQPGGEALLRRSRQPRLFPRVHVGDEPLRLTWSHRTDVKGGHHELSDAELSQYLEPLGSICRNVTRIGHSSSLVWARLERDSAAEPTHVPDNDAIDGGMRIVRAGAMRRLEEAFNQSAIDEFTALEEEIGVAKGKAKKELQGKSAERFPRGRPISQRPVFSISQGYRRVQPPQTDVPHTLFDPDFIVLREAGNGAHAYGLESAAAITLALRGLLMRESKDQPPPSWVSGHEPDGRKLESGHHLALIPLAFVGRPWIDAERHADGHLMGLGIVLPRSVSPRNRAKLLAPMLFDEGTSKPKTRDLTMGRAGTWKIVRDTDSSPKRMLQTETYNGPSSAWASVTPVLLDRMPKTERVNDPIAWREEVARIVATSCDHLFSHLEANKRPMVLSVRTEKTPFFRGSLRAMPGQSGFPQLRKDKHQVHVAIEFDRPVQGPMLLGAGRFRGYGLMRPWKNEEGA
ncbi:MAG: type I-U CRISPR-associated protein Csb2 [Phycisphaerales bacterium]